MRRYFGLALSAAIFALALLPVKFASAQHRLGDHPYRVIYPEQRQVEYRDPSQFPAIPLPPSSPPPTVTVGPTGGERLFSLDDAIRTSLENARVIRLLAGITAVTSGRTIYDPAVTNTTIDQALGRFDPFLTVNNNWDRIEQPRAGFNPVTGSFIGGSAIDQYRMNMALTKNNPLGGQWAFGVNVVEQTFPHSILPPDILPLNPQTATNTELSYTQPLLRGAGLRTNLAPVVIARINTEISFFQLKEAVQQNVRDVIAAYWNLVAAQATLTARQIQEDSLQSQYERVDAQRRLGLADLATASQVNVSYRQFKAQRIAAQTEVLQREAALRNLLGLPPWDDSRIVPTTKPLDGRFRPDWYELVDLAAAQRPDLVELKLILQADQQQLILANNNALPQLNANALYRWNGLEGELPTGNGIIATAPGQFTDWTLGVNFSVPLGQRAARAQLRQRELLIARDRANLDQGLHAASHDLATTLRSLDQAYEQYLAFTEARAPAEDNKIQRDIELRVGFANLLNYLLAVTDLGNVIIGQALAISQYNTFLADLELQTGTILETHGVRFYEERYGSIGPLLHLRTYPESTPPTPNYDRYLPSSRPAEDFFELQDLLRPAEELPPPR
jgi:outer membrane protein TolC